MSLRSTFLSQSIEKIYKFLPSIIAVLFGAVLFFLLSLTASAATFTVNHAGDLSDASPGDGDCEVSVNVCTLRAAIQEHNALGGTNTIVFSTTATINPATALVITADNLTIDGGSNHDVDINGPGTSTHHGIHIDDASNNVIKGLVIQNFKYGIYIDGNNATGNKIQNNYLGTNEAGTAAVPNSIGIYVYQSDAANIIGTDGDGTNDANEGNLTSGNSANGIYTSYADYVVIAGNKIGTNAAGDADLGNGTFGLTVKGADFARVGTDGNGTSDDLEGNVISGNGSYGLNNYQSNGSVIAGNKIGTNAAGTAAIGNDDHGLVIYQGTDGVRVGTNGDGTSDALEGNVISGNSGYGIWLNNMDDGNISGNKIGTNAAGDVKIQNSSTGIYISSGADSNIIGTNSDGISDELERNIIAGGYVGIYISDEDTDGNLIKGNYIGTAADGVTDFGGSNHGIRIDDGADSNIIGGSGTYDGNIIAYYGSGEDGISVEDATTMYNKITRNSIFGNDSLGIDLVSGNQNMSKPNITGQADGGASATITVSGTCAVSASGVTVEVFKSDGSGQGKTYLGSVTTTNGSWTLNITGDSTATGAKLVATATTSINNTSEFSNEYTITNIDAVASVSGTVTSAMEETVVSLVGTSSYDANSGDTVTYLWERTGGLAATINNSTSATANFNAPSVDEDGTINIRLTVGGGDTATVDITIVSGNTAPTVNTVTAAQSTAGDGDISISFIVDDADDDDTCQAKVEYSDDGGVSWYDPTLSTTGSETSASVAGDPSVDNEQTYQVGQTGAYILTSSGANTISIVWEAATDVASSTDISNAQIKVTPYDGSGTGTPATSSNFALDLISPSGISSFSEDGVQYDSIDFTWAAASDNNFDHYEIWYGADQSDVQNRTGTATEWDDGDDALLATASTTTTTVTGTDLIDNYFKIWAVDAGGNSITLDSLYVVVSSSGSTSSYSVADTSASDTSTSEESDSVTEETEDETIVEENESDTEEVYDDSVEEEVEDVTEESDDADLSDGSTEDITEGSVQADPIENHWAEGYVENLSEEHLIDEELLEEIVNDPNGLMNRVDAVWYLVDLLGSEVADFDNLTFDDLDTTDERTAYVQFAYDSGLVQGYEDNTFRPNNTLTRYEALKLVMTFFEIDVEDGVGEELLDLYYLDENPFGDLFLGKWFSTYVLKAYTGGIIQGYGDLTFRGDRAISYAEFVKIATLVRDFENAAVLASELE